MSSADDSSGLFHQSLCSHEVLRVRFSSGIFLVFPLSYMTAMEVSYPFVTLFLVFGSLLTQSMRSRNEKLQIRYKNSVDCKAMDMPRSRKVGIPDHELPRT